MNGSDQTSIWLVSCTSWLDAFKRRGSRRPHDMPRKLWWHASRSERRAALKMLTT